jgi:hypothetical protein
MVEVLVDNGRFVGVGQIADEQAILLDHTSGREICRNVGMLVTIKTC